MSYFDDKDPYANGKSWDDVPRLARMVETEDPPNSHKVGVEATVHR